VAAGNFFVAQAQLLSLPTSLGELEKFYYPHAGQSRLYRRAWDRQQLAWNSRATLVEKGTYQLDRRLPLAP